MESLDVLYRRVAETSSDMMEHCPTLRKLASQCKHVTEFGVRRGVSTVALLAGVSDNGGWLTSYDVVPCEEATALLAGHGNWKFIIGNSLEIDIEPTELLMIDTVHTGSQLAGELDRHAQKASRLIVLHDTEGCRDELWPVVERFTAQGDWRIREHHQNSFGLTVLGR